MTCTLVTEMPTSNNSASRAQTHHQKHKLDKDSQGSRQKNELIPYG